MFLSRAQLPGKNEAFKYSFAMKGVVCVPCVLFGQTEIENDRKKVTQLGALVTKPFVKYEKIHDRLRDHLSASYHVWSQ